MAGHSKWANIKHKKAATDAKRGKLWSKLSKAIIVAAKGGSDLDSNHKLRQAVADAKAASVPKDNIERAIKKGSGESGEAVNYEEIIYEGYGPNGVAVMCDILTDNRNRTAPELRKVFEKHGGKMGATGCVGWMFDRKGMFVISKETADEERVMEVTLEAGADDMNAEGDVIEVYCEPEVYTQVGEALETAEIKVESSQVTRIPQNTVELNVDDARQVLKLMEMLDDHDDVQNVSSNFDIPEAAMAELSAEG
ncbi:MAG: YebC/PmpR family DNA-binding transcriptional regulator [Planctomycetota bacterium]